jgi:hypothetical protein
MKLCVIHDYRITPGYFFKKTFFKPAFKKRAVCCMPVTFNAEIFLAANSSDYIYPFKFLTAFFIPDNISARRARIFPL